MDLVQTINTLFPDEHSLDKLDEVLLKLKFKNYKLEKEIGEIIRGQGGAVDGTKELDKAKKAINELYSKILSLKEKLEGIMVKEVTKDIRALDNAKKNLSSTITILKRSQMLLTAVEQIDQLKEDYFEIFSMVQVAIDLKSYFEPISKDSNRIKTLLNKTENCLNNLQKRIINEYENSFSRQGHFQGDGKKIVGCGQVADLFGNEFQMKIIEFYCNLQLQDYRALINVSTEISTLENMNRRFAWLKKILKTFEQEHESLFPKGWNVGKHLAELFCIDTKKDIMEVLLRTEEFQVKVLITALKETVAFETQLIQKFPNENSEISNFYRVISSCFEPYLSYYVDEEQALKNSDLEKEIDEKIFMSSTDLFYRYKQILKNCCSITNKKALLEISRIFGSTLIKFLDQLLKKIDSFQNKSIYIYCVLLNTLDYCHKTTQQLEEKIKDLIDVDLKEAVTFQNEIDSILLMISNSIKDIVKFIETESSPMFSIMTKLPWSTQSSVDDQSSYVASLNNLLKQSIEKCSETIQSKTFFQSVCDKFVDSFLQVLLQNIYKCKTISEVGAEQLLLDCQSIKKQISVFSSIGTGEESLTYSKLLNKGVAKIESLLKSVMTPAEPVDGLVENYILLNPDSTINQFQKVLELKGIKKIEQQLILDIFSKKTNKLQEKIPPTPPPLPQFANKINDNIKKLMNLNFK
ncbi:hypothetical protein ROZALSC1DRAFT_26786 [Rozella allomycis CSF55]|uniref:Vps53-like domain-containing protein n=1 Tax=Rozella allomycis (strain CSF55) TaxID=988480 RepID=A0A075AWL7_ROZAC|nr:Vps53-like domain-containing protein [Rozella allomycis CSF55]RKP21820.1 hypothetical protein ROZALSC1DRAFT_26786 [Rozella allomycis CSF55]|eukprot:EPZ34552.1 Vps53-like domain-containing protein [Rozella allomycis CSF55]